MTEAEWLAANANVWDMLRFVRAGKASDRQLRLFTCAGCRSRKRELCQDQRISRLLNMAERFSDRLVGPAEFSEACRAAHQLKEELVSLHDFERAAEVRDIVRAIEMTNSGRAFTIRVAGMAGAPNSSSCSCDFGTDSADAGCRQGRSGRFAGFLVGRLPGCAIIPVPGPFSLSCPAWGAVLP